METKQAKSEKQMIQMIYEVCRKGLNGSTLTKEWFDARKLHLNLSGAGYNSGQWNKTILKAHREELVKTGYLRLTGKTDAVGKEQYTVFARKSVVFPLKNEQDEVVNLCAIKVETDKISHLNDDGLYPAYPSPQTRRLFISTTVEEAVLIIENCILEKDEAVLSLFDGEIKPQHKAAIAKLDKLEEIIFFARSDGQS